VSSARYVKQDRTRERPGRGATGKARDADPPNLTNYDPQTEQAHFQAGEIRYSADVGHDGTRVLMRLERDVRAHVDRFDLASEAQRRRYAMSAAPKAKASFEARTGLRLPPSTSSSASARRALVIDNTWSASLTCPRTSFDHPAQPPVPDFTFTETGGFRSSWMMSA
jgi:hypothetical protein